MPKSDRDRVEVALAQLRANQQADEWPRIARRFVQAREQLGLTVEDVAGRLGITKTEYWDIEFHHDEAFNCFSVAELRQIATILATPLETLLFGPDFEIPAARISPATIAERLRSLAATEGVSIEELGDRVGWELESVLADPGSLRDFNLMGLSDVCHAIGVDWVAALADMP